MKTIPATCTSYKSTPTFTERTIPAGLLRAHQTKSGTWGKIVVLEGELSYRILEPEPEEILLDPENHGVVEPEILHEVEPMAAVKFYVEFFR